MATRVLHNAIDWQMGEKGNNSELANEVLTDHCSLETCEKNLRRAGCDAATLGLQVQRSTNQANLIPGRHTEYFLASPSHLSC